VLPGRESSSRLSKCCPEKVSFIAEREGGHMVPNSDYNVNLTLLFNPKSAKCSRTSCALRIAALSKGIMALHS
jgi:hypothetical protein